jgi:dTDP-4-amino-4,6-dideoxygalactose transaminase
MAATAPKPVQQSASAHIPFNKPCLAGQELAYMAKAVEQMHCSGDGPFTKQCQQLLEQLLSVPKVLLTTSCTHALEMAALLLDIQPGDEVIVPAFTFVSTINAFVLRGAKPVFVDIRPDTFNLDETRVEQAITARTKAIVPVHYAGVGCEMDTLGEIAARHNIAIIEDNAHGLWGRYKQRNLGTFGALATLSFHETKNISCGEGGALVINHPALEERAEILREKGTNRSRFRLGQVDKYTWVDLGSSYALSDLLAAFLYAQIEKSEEIQASRERIWKYYFQRIAPLAEVHGIGLPRFPSHCEQPYHMFHLLLKSLEQRQRLIEWLEARKINAVFHYLPLHLSEMGRKLGGKEGQCPVTESVSERLLRLPFYTDLAQEQQDAVVDAIQEFLERPTQP